MNRIIMVIGMVITTMCFTGCSKAPSESLVKEIFATEYGEDSADGVAIPMVDFRIISNDVTSNEKETFYNFVVEAHYTKKLSKSEIDSIIKKFGKSGGYSSFDLVQQYKCEFVKRRGDWFHTIETGHQVSQTFGKL